MTARMRILITTAMITTLCGCAMSTVTGEKRTSISEESVRVWTAGRPNCQLDEVGIITVPYAIGQQMMISRIKSKAAEMGAEHVLLNTVNSNANFEYSGGAVAVRCR
jgi:hypothetical protein